MYTSLVASSSARFIQIATRICQYKGGFPAIAETTRNHIFSKEISQVILAAMALAPNFYCKNCLRVVSAMRGNLPLANI